VATDDPTFFEATLAEDWHYTDVRGKDRTKQDYLAYIAPITADAPVNRMTSMVVRTFGSLALVHGSYEVAEALAPPEGSTTRFTALWDRRDGTWRALAHHATVARDES
jgi:ketosteroid isomerase-like protein